MMGGHTAQCRSGRPAVWSPPETRRAGERQQILQAPPRKLVAAHIKKGAERSLSSHISHICRD